ncbi:hypothetical protein Goklo_004220, partial [Gossypium klotzschianum]|nr:hypothetical protein [Gossypium klotzschianum]
RLDRIWGVTNPPIVDRLKND